MKRALALLVVLVLTAAAASVAQAQWGRLRRAPPRFPSSDSFDGAFTFCRGMYTSVRTEQRGQGWWTDYPDADINFSIRLSELTKTRVSRQPNGEPNYLVVRLSDDALFQCPFIEMEDVGTLAFSDDEVERLRAYLLKGGFLWVDDFWGPWTMDSWLREMERVLPGQQYRPHPVAADHPIFRTLYPVTRVPQIPSINFWRQTGGLTSELGPDSAVPTMTGISDKRGRLMVLMTHNTDISDAWEREGEDPRFFYSFSPDGYAVGINVIMYAMTH
jgi:hypothetical protein